MKLHIQLAVAREHYISHTADVLTRGRFPAMYEEEAVQLLVREMFKQKLVKLDLVHDPYQDSFTLHASVIVGQEHEVIHKYEEPTWLGTK